MGKSCAGNEYYKDDEISVEEIKAVNGTVKCKEAVGPKDAPMELMEQDRSLYIFISNISSFKETAEKRLVNIVLVSLQMQSSVSQIVPLEGTGNKIKQNIISQLSKLCAETYCEFEIH